MLERLLFSIGMVAVIAAPTLQADSIAWEVTGTSGFGTIDLNTGVFTPIGIQTNLLGGLGVLGGTLYGVAFEAKSLYTVDTATGDLTSLGTGSVNYLAFGSTLTGLYAIGTDGNLYSVNPSNGATMLIGPTDVSTSMVTTGLSTNSDTLYYSVGDMLYTISTSSGLATPVGTMGVSADGAMLFEGGLLWAGVNSPLSTQTLNTSSGAATPVNSVTGTTSLFYGLAPDPLPSSAPEPGTWSLLAGSIGALFCFRRRVGTTQK